MENQKFWKKLKMNTFISCICSSVNILEVWSGVFGAIMQCVIHSLCISCSIVNRWHGSVTSKFLMRAFAKIIKIITEKINCIITEKKIFLRLASFFNNGTLFHNDQKKPVQPILNSFAYYPLLNKKSIIILKH